MPIPVKLKQPSRVTYYDVEGSTLAKIEEKFQYVTKEGRFAGYTEIERKVLYLWSSNATKNGNNYSVDITLTPNNVTYQYTITVPNLLKPKGKEKPLSEKAATEWVNFSKALLEHENGHVTFYLNELTTLVNSIASSSGKSIVIKESEVVKLDDVKKEIKKIEQKVAKRFMKKAEADTAIEEIKRQGAGDLAEDKQKPVFEAAADKVLAKLETNTERYDTQTSHGPRLNTGIK